MMKFQKRFVPLLLALVLALGTLPVQAAALTRGEAAQALLSAAQDYNPGVQRSASSRREISAACGSPASPPPAS